MERFYVGSVVVTGLCGAGGVDTPRLLWETNRRQSFEAPAPITTITMA
jgi:hypothetical protein